MRRFALPALVAVVTGFSAGCVSIPVNTPEQTLSVPYSTFVPGGAVGATLPLLPAFNDIQAPAASFPVRGRRKGTSTAAEAGSRNGQVLRNRGSPIIRGGLTTGLEATVAGDWL